MIAIPDPSLVVLVGAAGAGKTTFAARHFAPDEILSSDDLRREIAGDPADQSATGPAFATLHRTLSARLGRGRLTVVDATSVRVAARRALLRRAALAGLPAIAIVLDLPAGVVLARNAARPGRSVPRAVVERQLASLQESLRDGGLEGEGFETVIRLSDPEALATLRIERRPRP